MGGKKAANFAGKWGKWASFNKSRSILGQEVGSFGLKFRKIRRKQAGAE
jgi:hypothetical protein